MAIWQLSSKHATFQAYGLHSRTDSIPMQFKMANARWTSTKCWTDFLTDFFSQLARFERDPIYSTEGNPVGGTGY